MNGLTVVADIPNPPGEDSYRCDDCGLLLPPTNRDGLCQTCSDRRAATALLSSMAHWPVLSFTCPCGWSHELRINPECPESVHALPDYLLREWGAHPCRAHR